MSGVEQRLTAIIVLLSALLVVSCVTAAATAYMALVLWQTLRDLSEFADSL